MMDIWKEIAELEAMMAAAERERREIRLESMKPHHPPTGLRIGK